MIKLKNRYTRRTFLRQTAKVGSLFPIAQCLKVKSYPEKLKDDKLQVHIFSKHLQFLDYDDMAVAAADIGFDGVELTVRPGGHVEPENVKADLPRAVAAIKKHNLSSSMMVTAINKLDSLSRSVLDTASDLGIQYYRLGYYQYPKEGSMPEALKLFQRQIQKLSGLNKELGLRGTYQNHAGGVVGASMWEVWHLLEGTDSNAMGSQYDIRHALVEGGGSWRNGLRLINERINTIVLKDFRWEKLNGKWQLLNTPLGEGMVDFIAYFKLLKHYNIEVPVTLHFEYDLFGVEHGGRELDRSSRSKVYGAMKKDLQLVHRWWQEA